jgi:hypothetical protein
LDGGRALSAWRRTPMLLLVVARWCRSRRRPGSARCSAEPARATPATGTRRWRAPGRPAASRPGPPPQGASRPAAATRRPPAHPSARPARPAPPRPPSSLPGARVHALDAKVSCTPSPGQRPLPLHRDLHRRHHHQRHGNGELPVGPEARPTPGPRCAHTRPTRGTRWTSRTSLRARHQPHRHGRGKPPHPEPARRGPGAGAVDAYGLLTSQPLLASSPR